jgi:protein-tyrosine-phosphatase
MRATGLRLALGLALALPSGSVAAARPGASLKYYMYEHPRLDFSHLLRCPNAAALVESAHGEGLQEVHVYERLAARDQPQRTFSPEEATAVYLPVMEYLSYRVGTCNGTTHARRMASAYAALRREPLWLRRRGFDHFWVSSKSLAYGTDNDGTPISNRTALPMKARMRPLSKLLTHTIVGRMKRYGAVKIKSRTSALGRCTFDVGYQPNQEALRLWTSRALAATARPTLVYFAGSFDVCCTGAAIRCHLAQVLHQTDGEADVRLVPSRGARGEGKQCTERALERVAARRGTTVDAVVASYVALSLGDARDRYVTMARTMASSVFCLAPAGDTCTSSRFYSALAAGCIPVVLCNKLSPAFHQFLNYKAFVVRFDTRALAEEPMALIRRLRAYTAAEVAVMQAALAAARPHVLFQAADGAGAVRNLLGEVDVCLNLKRGDAEPKLQGGRWAAAAGEAGAVLWAGEEARALSRRQR